MKQSTPPSPCILNEGAEAEHVGPIEMMVTESQTSPTTEATKSRDRRVDALVAWLVAEWHRQTTEVQILPNES